MPSFNCLEINSSTVKPFSSSIVVNSPDLELHSSSFETLICEDVFVDV